MVPPLGMNWYSCNFDGRLRWRFGARRTWAGRLAFGRGVWSGRT